MSSLTLSERCSKQETNFYTERERKRWGIDEPNEEGSLHVCVSSLHFKPAMPTLSSTNSFKMRGETRESQDVTSQSAESYQIDPLNWFINRQQNTAGVIIQTSARDEISGWKCVKKPAAVLDRHRSGSLLSHKQPRNVRKVRHAALKPPPPRILSSNWSSAQAVKSMDNETEEEDAFRISGS